MASNSDHLKNVERALEEQRLLREAINHPGVKLLFQKLHEARDTMARKQLDLDPYSQQSAIKRSQEFRYVVDDLFPEILESFVNYDPEAPDKQIEPKRRWKIIDWISTAVDRQKVSKK